MAQPFIDKEKKMKRKETPEDLAIKIAELTARKSELEREARAKKKIEELQREIKRLESGGEVAMPWVWPFYSYTPSYTHNLQPWKLQTVDSGGSVTSGTSLTSNWNCTII
jgi:hypothetical protein